MVVVLDGALLAALTGFFVPEVSVDFPEEAGAVFSVDADGAVADLDGGGGDAFADIVFRVAEAETALAELCLEGGSAGVDDDDGVFVALQEGFEIFSIFGIGFLAAAFFRISNTRS